MTATLKEVTWCQFRGEKALRFWLGLLLITKVFVEVAKMYTKLREFACYSTSRYHVGVLVCMWWQMEIFSTTIVACGFVVQDHGPCSCLTVCSALWTAPLALQMQHSALTGPFPFNYQKPLTSITYWPHWEAGTSLRGYAGVFRFSALSSFKLGSYLGPYRQVDTSIRADQSFIVEAYWKACIGEVDTEQYMVYC